LKLGLFDVGQILRYTLLLLLRCPWFTSSAILVLGLGIGINVAIFSLLTNVVLRPAPYPRSDRLATLALYSRNGGAVGVDFPDYQDICRAQQSFSKLAIARRDFVDITENRRPERLRIVFASSSLFSVTDRPFLVGRAFTEAEDTPGGPIVAVLSERFWRAHFAADPRIVGRTIILSEQSFQVIGIAPSQVDDWGPPPTDLYVPINVMRIFGYKLDRRDVHLFLCFGRLRDGVSINEAKANLAVIQQNLESQRADTGKDYEIGVSPLLDTILANYSATIWLIESAAVCVLLLSLANITNLYFVRSFERKKEMAVRAALGASGVHLIILLLAEPIVLSVLGGGIGTLVAFFAIQVIQTLSPADLYRFREVTFNPTAWLSLTGLTLACALIPGLLPAWRYSQISVNDELREDHSRSGAVSVKQKRGQSALVACQVGLAYILVFGATLLVRSFQTVQNVPLGFNPDRLLWVEIYPTSGKYADLHRLRVLFDKVVEKVRNLPDVAEAAMNRDLPFNWDGPEFFLIPGQANPEPGHQPTVESQEISSNYFKTMQIPLLSGRDFDEQDKENGQSVVIVDRAFADRFFPVGNAIGKQIQVLSGRNGNNPATIVGVVDNSLHNAPDQSRAQFQAYFPYSQRWIGGEALIVRTRSDPKALIPEIQDVVASVDSDIPVVKRGTFNELISRKFVTRQLGAFLIVSFSIVSLILSAIGLYGVLSYAVSQRRRDIAIRMAVGAPRIEIFRFVINHGLRLVGLGLAFALIGSVIFGRFISSTLYGVSEEDPATFIFVALLMVGTATLACSIPAYRAAKIDPITTLRR
jgi:putative ABC transport system permease protein